MACVFGFETDAGGAGSDGETDESDEVDERLPDA